MAFTNEGTVYSISSRLVPNDFENPTINKFQDYEDARLFVLEVDRDTVANADPATTLENILNNPTIGINKQISDIFEEEMNYTDNDVDVWSVVEKLETNVPLDKDGGLLTNAAVKFVATVRSYWKNEPTPGGED